ncbi:hypothetical protein GCM10011506_36080 [Marivirga lumbricoides]|uniref:Uncharacterized protein n=1 Tax=Marivirga lumbricoides TaxID=1046115 RepID=A0A2T4DR51_9BACT|nr:hypothetical protein C9994_08335 [Marivirga lumbricoides]GGC47306.1 hypothetical protein GCM10011506_36080 [Marivirga lumbricoides]
MKKIKYILMLTLLFGVITFSCNDERVNPVGTTGGGSDDEEDDPIILDPPGSSQNPPVPLDSLIN